MVRVELWKVRSDSGRVIKQVYTEEEAQELAEEGYTVEKWDHYETIGQKKRETLN